MGLEGLIVLLTDGANSFGYFRIKCPVQYKKRFPRLRKLAERLTEGHRVNHDPELDEEPLRLKRVLWKARSPIASTPVPQADGKCDCDNVAVECGGC